MSHLQEKNKQEKKEEKLEVRLNLQETKTPLKPVADWTKEEVGEWIEKDLKLPQLKQVFINNNIIGKGLLGLKNQHYERMEIDVGSQIIIDDAISKLKEGIFKFLIIFRKFKEKR